MQQVVAERRFAAFFTPLFSLRIVEGGVLAGRSSAVLIAIANDGRADKQHQVAFRHFLAVGAEQGADHRNIPEQRHFVSGIGDGFIQQPANHHRFAAADQHGVIHRPGIEGRPEIAAGAGGRVGNARYLLLNLQQHRIAFVNLRFHLQFNADGFALDGIEDVVAGGGLRAG